MDTCRNVFVRIKEQCMLLNTDKMSHSHPVQCCDSCRSLYSKGLEQEEKMALLHLGKNTKTTMPLLGRRLDKFIN